MKKRKKRFTNQVETAAKIVSDFSRIQRANYRKKQALQGRVPKTDTAEALGITKQTIANWEPYVIAAIPDYASHYAMRQGFTKYQVWVWFQILPEYLNGKGREKLTFEQISTELASLAEKYSFRRFEQEYELGRSGKTA